MEYSLIIVIICVEFSYTVAHGAHDVRGHGRSKRDVSHPAFGMMMGSPMAFPGNNMQTGYMDSSEPECITEDIVCPAWCLMEDEWGCKYCPCGPANGMSPPIVTHRKPAEVKHEKSDDCIGTILCMLSCKDGYKLGPRDGEEGCQSCTCVKKNESKDAETTKNETKNDTNSNQTTESCKWPMCMNGNRPNQGPGAGAGMSSLPIGGGGDKGGSMPGVDCMGPSCSAKNGLHGMRMLGNSASSSTMVKSPSPTSVSPIQAPPLPPTQKPMLIMPPTQGRLLIMPPTKPPSQLYLLPVQKVPPKRPCAALEYCMNYCQHGFEVDNSRQDCPDCKCVLPLTPPLPISTTKPDFMSIMHVCPEAVHCMKSCTQGYVLTSSHTGACPKCTCNKEPKVLLLCERPLSCSFGCSVGYKGDDIGCPACSCISPSETKLEFQVQTTVIQSALTCDPRFSCVDRCTLGYRTGDNGCPTCVCLEPITVHPSSPMVGPQLQPVPPIDSGNCIGPECSAIHALPPRLMLQCDQPLSCPYGCTLGYKCNTDGCPTCNCIAPFETDHATDVQTVMVAKVINCMSQFSCLERCEFGFQTGIDGCPTCTCLQKLSVQTNTGHPQQPYNPQIIQHTLAPIVHQIPLVPDRITQMTLPPPVDHQMTRPAIVDHQGIVCLSLSCQPQQQTGLSGNNFLPITSHVQQIQQPVTMVTQAPVGVQKPLDHIDNQFYQGQGGYYYQPVQLPQPTQRPGNNIILASHLVQKPSGHGGNSVVSPASHHQQTQTHGNMAPAATHIVNIPTNNIDNHFYPGKGAEHTVISVTEHVPNKQQPEYTTTLAPGRVEKPTGIMIEHQGGNKEHVTSNTAGPKPTEGNQTTARPTSSTTEGSTPLSTTTRAAATTNITGFSAVKVCPETIQCMIGCQGSYNLTQRDGNICPECKCTQEVNECAGPACSTPGSHISDTQKETSTPSPGECIAILHCVMTCDSGYDLGEYSRDGCPTCTCL